MTRHRIAIASILLLPFVSPAQASPFGPGALYCLTEAGPVPRVFMSKVVAHDGLLRMRHYSETFRACPEIVEISSLTPAQGMVTLTWDEFMQRKPQFVVRDEVSAQDTNLLRDELRAVRRK